jgi:hypothetical protein
LKVFHDAVNQAQTEILANNANSSSDLDSENE